MSRPAPSLLVVTYHYVRDPDEVRYPGIYPVSMERFSEDIDRLGEECGFVTPQEAELFLRGEAEFDGPRILIAFDDGLDDQWRAARQVLDPRGVKASFFVASRPHADRRALLVNKLQYLRSISPPARFRKKFLDKLPPEALLLAEHPAFRKKAASVYVHDNEPDACMKYLANFSLGAEVTERIVDHMLALEGIYEGALCAGLYMNADRLRRLHRSGHMVGCHGHSHRPLGSMIKPERDREVATSLETLSGILGKRPGWISFPYGRGDAMPRDAERLCNDFGFRVGMSLHPGWNWPNGCSTGSSVPRPTWRLRKSLDRNRQLT